MHENIKVYIAYIQPAAVDRLGEDYASQRRINLETIKALVPNSEADFYLCGPPAFMQEIYDGLLAWGVRSERLRFEFFGPAEPMQGDRRFRAISGPAYKIDFQSGVDPIIWDGKSTLLDHALNHHLTPNFGCRGMWYLRLQVSKRKYSLHPRACSSCSKRLYPALQRSAGIRRRN